MARQRDDEVLRIAESMPEMYLSRENIRRHVNDDAGKNDAECRFAVRCAAEIRDIVSYYNYIEKKRPFTDAELVSLCELSASLALGLFPDGDMDGEWYDALVFAYQNAALHSAADGHTEAAFDYIERATACARGYLERSDGHAVRVHTSPLVRVLGEYKLILALNIWGRFNMLKLYAKPGFDSICDDPRFIRALAEAEELDRAFREKFDA